MKKPTLLCRVAVITFIGSLFTVPFVTSVRAASSGVIKACVEKSTQSIVISSSCSLKTHTAISWKKAGQSQNVIKVCVARASFVTRWTSNNNCGKDLLVRWTVRGSSTASMTGCVDKTTHVLIYSPMDWCAKTSYKLSWLRTIGTKNSSTTTTTNSIAPTTTVASHATTTTSTTTTVPSGNYIGTQFGSDSDDGITGMAVDTNGNTYSTGYMCGTASGAQLIGGGSGSCGTFVAKHSATDQLLWMKRLDFNDASGQGRIALSPNGAIYVVASTTIGSNKDVQLSKFDSSGANIWNATFGTARVDEPQAIAVDASENIFIAGETQGDFADPSVDNPYSQSNIFVGKYHWSSGSLINDWVTGYGSNKKESVSGLKILSSGSLAISGDTRGVMPGSGAATPASNTDAPFVSKLDATGTVTWTKQWTGAAPIYSSGITTDSSGAIYLTGWTTTDMRSLSIDTHDVDGFVIKLNVSTGATVWTRIFGSSGTDITNGVVIDTDGTLLIGGYTDGTIAGKTLSTSYHPFAVKIDDSGNFQWIIETAITGNSDTYVWTVAADPRGGFLLGGESPLNFGGLNVDSSNSTADNLYLRVSSAGSFPAKHN